MLKKKIFFIEKMRSVILFAVVAALLVSAASAWWCTGHMVVAEIAQLTVPSDVADKVNEVMKRLSDHGFPESPDIVNGACWADDIKALGISSMGSWHYSDQPYNPSNIPIDADQQQENVVTVLSQMIDGLRRKKASRPWIEEFALANLIHAYGDIHNPAHAVSYFSAKFPTGDQGGNFFHVKLNGNEVNLHKIWDSVCYTQTQNWERPLSEGNMKYLKDYSKSILEKFIGNISPSNRTVFNPVTMAQESYTVAVEYMYKDVVQNEEVSKTYIERCVEQSELRMVLGGLRLGSELAYLYRSTDEGWFSRIRKDVRNKFISP